MQLIIYTDGGSRGNPGAAAIGVVVFSQGKELYTHAESIGVATNNEAEYQAFIHSVDWLVEFSQSNQVSEVRWQLDSKLVVEQLLKHWKIKEPRMKSLAEKAWKSLAKLSCSHTISHIPRAENAVSDSLVNAALDAA
ncbi:MAG: ribonuclease HI family protein [Patescibacteria group bacterium]